MIFTFIRLLLDLLAFLVLMMCYLATLWILSILLEQLWIGLLSHFWDLSAG